MDCKANPSDLFTKYVPKKTLDVPCSHFGSRAISVQVSIVAVSDHVFHMFPFDLLFQVSATQHSVFMANARTFDSSALDLERTGGRSSTWEDKINEMSLQFAQMPQFFAKRIQNRELHPFDLPVKDH